MKKVFCRQCMDYHDPAFHSSIGNPLVNRDAELTKLKSDVERLKERLDETTEAINAAAYKSVSGTQYGGRMDVDVEVCKHCGYCEGEHSEDCFMPAIELAMLKLARALEETK